MPASRRTRFLFQSLLVIVAGLLATAALGQVITYGYDTWFAKSRAQAEDDAQRQLDQEEAPFTARAEADVSALDGNDWTIVLDRPLTAAEVRSLEALDSLASTYPRDAWQLLGPLGGRVIGPVPRLQMVHYGGDFLPDGPTTVVRLNLFSERTAQLSVTGMQARIVRCGPSSARFVLRHPPQGEAFYPGVLFDLRRKNPVPVVTDEGKDQGRAYFDQRKIDLGGGNTPGGLRVAATVGEESCDWEIKATYEDAAGGGEVVLRNGDRPFRAESPPRAPDQLFLYHSTLMRVVPCHGPQYATDVICRSHLRDP
ncbi:hypothetical protein ACIGEZ_01025 [Streptomyces sp. NPDC085481]|uniref:hypothetical protein n=1 Tax=Streptomyces sp. NPDC085481 TaxID=3365727 RepID=UPI0037CD2D22